MNNISKIFSTLFFIGFVIWAPGTFGSIFSIIIIFLLSKFLDNIQFYILFVIISAASLFFINIYSKNINKIDPPEIVIDEFIGIYIIAIFWDDFIFINDFLKIILTLFFFRFFDFFKIFPANWINKNMKNSLGVVLDDLIAGVYSIIILSLINEIIQKSY